MRRVLRVFSKTDPSDNPISRVHVRNTFFRNLSAAFSGRCESGDGFIEIENSSDEDLAIIAENAEKSGVGFSYVFDDLYSASDYRRARLIRLGIEGEPVDLGDDDRALNEYPILSCCTCSMPIETSLPSPYVVSKERVFLGQNCDEMEEAKLKLQRKVFNGLMGVLIVARRVKSILECVVGDHVVFSPVGFQPRDVSCGGMLWAVRPVLQWGSQEGRDEVGRCLRCSEPTVARLNSNTAASFSRTRYVAGESGVVSAEIVSSNGWFGDRIEDPFGYWRDVLVSGRLYSLLLGLGIKGIARPEDIVWIDGEVPMYSESEVTNWLKKSRSRIGRG